VFKEISKRQLFLWGGFIFIRSVLQLFGYSRAASSLSIRFGSLGINDLYELDLSRDITLPPLYTFVTKTPSDLCRAWDQDGVTSPYLKEPLF